MCAYAPFPRRTRTPAPALLMSKTPRYDIALFWVSQSTDMTRLEHMAEGASHRAGQFTWMHKAGEPQMKCIQYAATDGSPSGGRG